MSMYDIEHFMRKAAGVFGSQNMEMLSNEIICKGVLFMSQFDPGAIVLAGQLVRNLEPLKMEHGRSYTVRAG